MEAPSGLNAGGEGPKFDNRSAWKGGAILDKALSPHIKYVIYRNPNKIGKSIFTNI